MTKKKEIRVHVAIDVTMMANEITNHLFCVGKNNEARRLVIEQLNGKDGGGWCKNSVHGVIQDVLDKQVKKAFKNASTL